MRGVLIIFKKELAAQFRGMSFWFAASFLIFLEGYLLVLNLVAFGDQRIIFGGSAGADFNTQMIEPMIQESGFLVLLLLPFFTASLFAQEKREGTLECLVSQPVGANAIVWGKWAAATLTLFLAAALPKAGLAWLSLQGGVDLRHLAAGLLGILLLCGAMVALGLFVSSLTDSVVFAFAFTLLAGIGLWIVGFLGQISFDPSSRLLGTLSLADRLNSFSTGFVAVEDIVFLATFAILWIFLTRRSLEAQGWT